MTRSIFYAWKICSPSVAKCAPGAQTPLGFLTMSIAKCLGFYRESESRGRLKFDMTFTRESNTR